MWRAFWFRNDARGSAPGATAGVYAPDVLLANWVTPVQLPEVNAAAFANQAPRGDDLPTDAGAFLLRVYANQGC